MRHFCVIVSCILLFHAGRAQFTVGPKAGLNVAKISFSSSNFKTGFQPGLYAGAFANYEVNAHWSGQFEVLHSGEGGREKATNGEANGHINETLIQFPLLAQYHSMMGLYGEAGPQLGVLAAIRETYNGMSSTSIKQYYHTTEFRFPFGAGYVFSNASKLKGLGINARYSFSFSKINKDAVGGESLKNSVISIGAFYKIPVGRVGRKSK